jgi:spermidine synthase/MFS family permease
MAAERFGKYAGVQPSPSIPSHGLLINMASATTAAVITPAPTGVPLPAGRLAGIGLIIFLANAALLVLQLVASRLLAPFIGSSLETWTSIIGVFLLGIALGNAFGGRLADRYPSSRTLAILLALSALAAVWMVILPQSLASTGAYKRIPLGPRIPVLALALCLPAGFVLSLLTPLAIKLGLPDVSKTGRVAGLIFALSTLGCLIGNYVTGFVLIPAFTINTLVFVAAGALSMLAIGTFLFLKDPPPHDDRELLLSAVNIEQVELASTRNPHAFSDIRLAYTIVFLASFGGMTLELTASRVLAQYLGVSLFTWTGIIGVMLAGTALGNFTGGQLADRAVRPGEIRRPLACLAAIFLGLIAFGLIYRVLPWVCFVFGVPFPIRDTSLLILAVIGGLFAAYGSFKAVGRLAGEVVNPRSMLATTLLSAGAAVVLLMVTRVFLTRTEPFDRLDPIAQVFGWTFSLFFLPMFILGMVSPQVIRLAVPDVEHIGRVAGRVYAWSTAGAIVGTFAAGYVLLSASFLGTDRTLLGVALIVILTSLLVARVWENSPMLYLFSIVLGGVTGGFILTARGETDPHVIAKLETNYYTIKVTEGLDDWRQPDGTRDLTLDHLLHSRVDPDRPTYLYYTHEHIQMEFLWAARVGVEHPRALVIGGGGYTFPRYAMEILPETRMDVVEIDPGVTRVAYEHLGLKPYPGLNIVHMDGRQFVSEKVVPETYDLVVQDAVNDLSVPSHLLTKEYNDAIKLTLRPDGVYLLTVIDSIKYGRLWRSAVRTLRESFSHVELVSSSPIPSAEPPAGAGDEERKEWRREVRALEENRQVLVIYAADRPLDEERVRAEVMKRKGYSGNPHAAAVAGSPAIELMGPILKRGFYTHTIPQSRLAPFLEADPGVLLTDQYAPVDNLMAEVFRYRYRYRPDQKKED